MTDFEKAFAEWPHTSHPHEYFIQKQAFKAGWDACVERFRELDFTLAELEAEVKRLKAKHGEAD